MNDPASLIFMLYHSIERAMYGICSCKHVIFAASKAFG